MSASGAAGEESSRALQDSEDAEQEPPQRRSVVLVSNPVILAAAVERAQAMDNDMAVELDRHDPLRPSYSYLVLPYADAEPEPQERRGVALVSTPITLTAADERAWADTDVELDLHEALRPSPSYLVRHPRMIVLDPGYIAHQPSAYILAADRAGRLLFRVTNPGSNDHAEDDDLCNTHARRAIITTIPAVPCSDLGVEAQPRRSIGVIADPDPRRRGHYQVAQLCPRPSAALLADNANKLIRYSTAEPQWFLKPLLVSAAVRMPNLCAETGVLSCEDCLVRDDREIMLQNSRAIVDAWEQSSPMPSSSDELAVQSSDARYTGLDNGTPADDAVVGAPVEFSSAAAPGDSSSAGKAHDVPVGRQEDDAMARNRRSHVAAETELRRPHSNGRAGSVLQGPLGIADLGTHRSGKIGDAPHIKKGTATHNAVPPEAIKSRNGDDIYMKALDHTFSMDYVTVNKLHSMLKGEANKSTVRKLIKRMVKDGFLSSNNQPMGRSVIRSQTTETKLLQMKKMLDGNNVEQKIRSNSLKLSLDGTPKQVEKNFKKFIKEVRRWYYRNGIKANVSSILGRSKEVYTTSERGTLYVDVMHQTDCVTFVIQARHHWLRGYLVGDVAYELKPDVKGQFYMPHPNHRELPFKGNHHNISGGNPGGLILGLDKLRKSLKSIVDSGSNPDPKTFGIFTLYLCEAPKFQPVFNQLCKSLVSPGDSRLEMNSDRKTMNDLLRSWDHFSENIMRYVDCVHHGKELPELRNKHDVPGMDSIEKYIHCVRILHLDGHNEGLFHHKGLTDPKIWEDKEMYGGVARMRGVSGKEEKLNYKDTDKRKQKGFSKGGVAAAKQQSLKPNPSRSLLPNKTEVGTCNSIRKRYMSTGFSYQNGDCHMKPVQDIQLVCSTKTVQQPQGLPPSPSSIVSSNKPVTKDPFCSFNSQMKFDQAAKGLSLSLSATPKLSYNLWFNSHFHMPKHPACSMITMKAFSSFISYKMNSNKAINQIVHDDGLGPRVSTTQKLSNTRWFKRQVPMPKNPILLINTGIIGGMTRIIQHVKGKADAGPKTLPHNQIEMPCPHNWPRSPGLQKSEYNTKIRFSVRASRAILGILHK